MRIGPHTLSSPVVLAPMAGVTDRPFRSLCRRYGAGLTVSEMISANPALRHDRKTLQRVDHGDEPGLRSVQILGNDPVNEAGDGFASVQDSAEYKLASELRVEFAYLSSIRDLIKL